MVSSAGVTPEQIKNALEVNATLGLLKAYSRDWVLPLLPSILSRLMVRCRRSGFMSASRRCLRVFRIGPVNVPGGTLSEMG